MTATGSTFIVRSMADTRWGTRKGMALVGGRLLAGGLMLLAAGVAGCGPTKLSSHSHSHPRSRPRPAGACRTPETTVVDLSHSLHNDVVTAPGAPRVSIKRTSDYEQGQRAHTFEMGEAVGTHVDAPAHMVEGKRSVDQIPLSELVVPVVVIDVRTKVEKDPDYQVTGNDIVDWEAIHGPLPIGGFVIAYTGWYERFEDPDKYLNLDDKGVMHFPGFSKAAAQLLVERDVIGIGIDTLSVDPGASTGSDAHKVMFAANKYQIENLDNLEALPETGATLIVGVLPVSDGSRAPARVLALVPLQPPDDEEDEEEETP